MAQTIKSVKQKLASGLYSNPIPFGADGENIDLINGHNLEETLGNIDVTNQGNIKAQLQKHTDDIATNKANIDSNDNDIIELQKRDNELQVTIEQNAANIAANKRAIESNDADITNLDNKIATNAQAIADNKEAIESNDADIVDIYEKIQKNVNDIATNKVNIELNDEELAGLQTLTQSHTEGIADNLTKINANQAAIEANDQDIINVNERIDTIVNTDLITIKTKISDNATAIQNNSAIIAANKQSTDTQILTLQSKDNELQTAIESNDTDIININTTLEQHAADIEARVTKEEAKPFIKKVDYNSTNFTLTFTMYDNTTQVIDLPLEDLLSEGYYDVEKEEIVLVLTTGDEIRIPASSLVANYTGIENTQIKTVVSESNTVEAILKANSIDETFFTENLKTRLSTIETNIADRYTKLEVDNLLAARSEFVAVESW